MLYLFWPSMLLKNRPLISKSCLNLLHCGPDVILLFSGRKRSNLEPDSMLQEALRTRLRVVESNSQDVIQLFKVSFYKISVLNTIKLRIVALTFYSPGSFPIIFGPLFLGSLCTIGFSVC